MSQWKEYQLGDLVTFQRGHDITKNDFKEGPYPIAGSNGIVGFHNEYTTPGPGITLGRSGNSIGVPHYYKNNYWAHNTTLYSKRFHGTNPKFIFYLLKTLNLRTLNSGSAVPSLNRNYIHPFKVTVPSDINEQKAIAEILSSLDDKIELNNRINQNLEALARTLFKRWFVDFEFLNENGEPYQSSGGEMVESELGMIPKGWEVGTVNSISQVNQNTLSTKDKLEWIDYIEISEVSLGVINKKSRYERGMEPSRAKRRIRHGDTVLSTVRPNRKSYFLAFHPEENDIVSTGFAVFSPNNIPYSFLYLLLTSDEKFDFYGRMADGAAYPAINPSVIIDIELIIPSHDILNDFHLTADPIIEQIANHYKENEFLKDLRDTLLPKLISGKLTIQEAEQETSNVL